MMAWRRTATDWTNNGPVHWRIYAYPGFNVLTVTYTLLWRDHGSQITQTISKSGIIVSRLNMNTSWDLSTIPSFITSAQCEGYIIENYFLWMDALLVIVKFTAAVNLTRNDWHITCILYKLRSVQNTGTCYPGQGWFVRNLGWGL